MGVKTIPVNEYVDKLLGEKDSISSSEMKIDGDFDYVMLMMVAMDYDPAQSPYRLRFSKGQAKINGYGIPNMVISRK